MDDEEIELHTLETQFAKASGAIFAEARRKVLNAGQSVLQSEGGVIYRVHPDCSKEPFKTIEPPIPVTAGTRYILR